jgi:circadian clock protein KaiB
LQVYRIKKNQYGRSHHEILEMDGMIGFNDAASQSCSDHQRVIVHLYVSGANSLARESLLTVRRLCEREFGARYELTTIDLNVSPEWAETHHILVTPTLVRVRPGPERRCVGDLSDASAMWVVLQSWLEEVGCHLAC